MPSSKLGDAPSADGPGEHQKGPLETSLGHPSAPHPRPIHQREETHPSDEGSGKPEANGVPSTPLRTTYQTTEDTGPWEQPWTTGSPPAWTPPGVTEAPTNNPPTPSMAAESQDPRLSAQPGRSPPVVASSQPTHQEWQGTNILEHPTKFNVYIRLCGQGRRPMDNSHRRGGRPGSSSSRSVPGSISGVTPNSGQIKLSKSPPPPRMIAHVREESLQPRRTQSKPESPTSPHH